MHAVKLKLYKIAIAVAMLMELVPLAISSTETEFHLVTKIWGGSAINEWAYSARKFLGTYF